MGLREDLEAAQRDGVARLMAAADAPALEAVRIALLGRNGRLKELKEAFAAASVEDKRALGPAFNAAQEAIKEAFAARARELAAATQDKPIDLTLPERVRRPGAIHPISQVAHEVEQVFQSMGFEVIDGPHVELEDNNFNRLNIPADHPARDAQDTFWLAHPTANAPRLLRTHTSAVQSRTYPVTRPPFRKVVVGKVFRYEAVDATHDNTFTQVEGILVDKAITVAHLVGVIRTMLTALLKRDDIEMRLRPHFFPFVEPGFEVDVRLTRGEGRLAQWMELLGCGMIHPTVLTAGGIDPSEWQGFAFGLGMERLTMVRHGINDIRLFNGADLRGIRQFGAG
ncbi:MAG TPA: phenylalanine--tRNA ligase subunit alpha [Planctomycetota bacterium]|nr:phenylalanine--tRNA ligase subunit alpha [Planctomycetota bacterium]